MLSEILSSNPTHIFFLPFQSLEQQLLASLSNSKASIYLLAVLKKKQTQHSSLSITLFFFCEAGPEPPSSSECSRLSLSASCAQLLTPCYEFSGILGVCSDFHLILGLINHFLASVPDLFKTLPCFIPHRCVFSAIRNCPVLTTQMR